MSNVIKFPQQFNAIEEVEAIYFDLQDVGAEPSVVVSNLGIMSLTFEIGTSKLSPDQLLEVVRHTTELFEQQVKFRQLFFEVALSYGGVLQEFGLPQPVIDARRTIDDVRAEYGVAELI